MGSDDLANPRLNESLGSENQRGGKAQISSRHWLNRASFQVSNRLRAISADAAWAHCKFLREYLQLSPWGKRWVVQHPQLVLWDGSGWMQHSLLARPHLSVKGGLCRQGVRVELFHRACPDPPFGGTKGMSASSPPNTPLPPPVQLPTPADP